MNKMCVWCYKEIDPGDLVYRVSRGHIDEDNKFDLDKENPPLYMHHNCMENMEMDLSRAVVTDFEH